MTKNFSYESSTWKRVEKFIQSGTRLQAGVVLLKIRGEGPDNSRSLNGMIKAHVVNLLSQRRVVDTKNLVVFQPYFFGGCDADVVWLCGVRPFYYLL